MQRLKTVILLTLLCSKNVLSGWYPVIPTGNRAQYYFILPQGGYKYGYDTGSGSYAIQKGDATNEVEGLFAYDAHGQPIRVEYTAGAQGYVPVIHGLPVVAPISNGGSSQDPQPSGQGEESNGRSGDASYSFSYQNPDSAREESSDAQGNVQGRYSYTNDAGHHDLSYIAGSGTGFVATGGSLATPNGLGDTGPSARAQADQSGGSSSPENTGSQDDTTYEQENSINTDGSYSFSYKTQDSSRQESADAQGNVQGHYSYQNSAGNHDLSYKAGAETGFVATGGSLATPNGLGDPGPSGRAQSVPQEAPSSQTEEEPETQSNADKSYSFSYETPESAREESADAQGNVKGRYSYTNDAGHHDLSYIAGSGTGFVATGGSLAIPNGLGDPGSSGKAQTGDSGSSSNDLDLEEPQGPSVGPETTAVESEASSSDGSQSKGRAYSFSYQTQDSARDESSDAQGNVQGQYSYTNDAGHHDLSYIAGSGTGFVATGGSLATPNGLGDSGPSGRAQAGQSGPSSPENTGSQDDTAQEQENSLNTDGSYSFSYKTQDSSRQESADAQGNVQGHYSYQNSAGNHDLSYKAGAETGFVATGGSLAIPNGLGDSGPSGRAQGASSSPSSSTNDGSTQDQQNSSNTDGSYRFSYKTQDSSREESADAQGNVQGHYSYQNAAGRHDLSYKAGAETGFVATGGSLATPNGLPNQSAPQSSSPPHTESRQYLPPEAPQSPIPSHLLVKPLTHETGNLVVHNWLPVVGSPKHGYVFHLSH